MLITDVKRFTMDGRPGKVDMYDASTKCVYWDDGRIGWGFKDNIDEYIESGRMVVLEQASKLVMGNIPAGAPCPFHSKCGLWRAEGARCPTPENLKGREFSCAAARGYDLIQASTTIRR